MGVAKIKYNLSLSVILKNISSMFGYRSSVIFGDISVHTNISLAKIGVAEITNDL